MNILMITPDYPPNVFGGIGTYVDWLVDNLVRMGHRVFLIVSRADYFIDHTYTLERRHNLTIARFDVRSPISCVYVCNTSLNYYSYKSNCNAITQLVKEARLRVCNLASYTIKRRKKAGASTCGWRAFSNSSRQI